MSKRKKVVKLNKISSNEAVKILKELKSKGQDNSKYADHLRCRVT